MELKKTHLATLKKKLAEMKQDNDNAVGSYLYNGYRIQISKYNLSTNERVLALYYRRKAKGLCVLCGKKVCRKNPRTKKLYRLCDKHRQKIDHKK